MSGAHILAKGKESFLSKGEIFVTLVVSEVGKK